MSFCNGCTACCRGDKIELMPGDDPSRWETVEENGKLWLRRDEKGNCIYLKDDGCSIHGQNPIVCKSFNCANYFQQNTRQRRRQLIKHNPRFKAIFDAGRARMQGV